jgi:steroid-24-oyl-CoA synthetase
MEHRSGRNTTNGPADGQPDLPEPGRDAWGTAVVTEPIDGIPFRMFHPRPRSVGDLLREARRWPDAVHLVHGDSSLTFADLERAARCGAADLRTRSIGVGDCVAICGWNTLEWVISFWSIMVSGATAVLFNPAWSKAERDQVLAATAPKLVLDDTGQLIGAHPMPHFARLATCVTPAPELSIMGSDEDPAVIVFTSGTTSAPRGAVLTHRAVIAAQHDVLFTTRKLPGTLPADWRGDVQLQTIPLFHIGGFQQLISALLTRGRMVFLKDRFDPAEALALIETHGVRRWGAIPTMLTRVLNHPDASTRDLSSMRVVGLGGAPVSPVLTAKLTSIFPNATSGGGQVYGMSEAGGLITTAAGDPNRPTGSAGRALPLVEIRIDGGQRGEILVRSPAQMSGYCGQPDSPIDGEGWLHTGDIGHLDDDGYLYISGRSKDVIIRGGENISPAQVEAALLAHPEVLEAAVIGLPDADLGEIVAACVVIAPTGTTTVDSATLGDFLRGRVASFATPSRWWLRTEPLPTNASGKVVKRDIATHWPADTGDAARGGQS